MIKIASSAEISWILGQEQCDQIQHACKPNYQHASHTSPVTKNSLLSPLAATILFQIETRSIQVIEEVGAIDRKKNYWIPRPDQCKCPAAVRMHNKLHHCPIFKICKWGVLSPTHRLAHARCEIPLEDRERETTPHRILVYENHEPWQAKELTRE